MLGRFRKKSSAAPESMTEKDSTPSRTVEDKVEKELEVEFNPTGDEIDQARQDLMRAAMEAIAMPAAEPGSTDAAATTVKDEEIPVIQVKIKRPEPKTPLPSKSEPQTKPPTPLPSKSEPQTKPPAPQARSAPTPRARITELPTKIKWTEPTKSLEPSPPAPEPVIAPPPEPEPTAPAKVESREIESVTIKPETIESIPTKIETPADVVPIRTEPMVVEPESPQPDSIAEPQNEEEEDIPEPEIIAQIAPETEILSSRIMTYADTESTVEPLEIPSEEKPLESPASEISPVVPSLPPRHSESDDDPQIAQLDEIMTDIVRQDITSHRKRLAQ
jgi:hypothetical protein